MKALWLLLLLPLFQLSTACLSIIRAAISFPENIPLSTKRFKAKMSLPKVAGKMRELETLFPLATIVFPDYQARI